MKLNQNDKPPEVVFLTKFCYDSLKIVDFLLVVNFDLVRVFFNQFLLVLVLCETSRLWLMHNSDTIQYFLYSWLKHASFNHEQKHKVKQENKTAKELST